MNRREYIKSFTALWAVAYTKQVFSSKNLTIENSAGEILLSNYIFDNIQNGIGIIKTAYADALYKNLPLVIDCKITVWCDNFLDSIELQSNSTIIFRNGGEIEQTSFGVPIFWGLYRSNIQIIKPRFVFSSTIPIVVPSFVKDFTSYLFQLCGYQPISSSECTAVMLLWYCNNVSIQKPVFIAKTNLLDRFVHICLDIYQNGKLTITDATFDGVVMGIVGSGCTDLKISAKCLRRGNLDQNIRPWSAPGHVVYISPSISTRSNNIILDVIEYGSEPEDSFDQAASTVSIKDSDNCKVNVESSFSQGVLTVAGVSGVFRGKWFQNSNRLSKYAELRVLTTGHQDSFSCKKSKFDFQLSRTNSVSYIELGNVISETAKGGAYASTFDILIYTQANYTSPPSSNPLFILRGSGNIINLTIIAPNFNNEKIYPIMSDSDKNNNISVNLSTPNSGDVIVLGDESNMFRVNRNITK